MDIKALFEYNWYCRRKFLESIEKLPWERVVENREASFNSMRNIFLHSLDAEQYWLRRLAGRKIGEALRRNYDREFPNIEAMRKHMDEVEAESRAYLAKLGPKDLQKPPGWLRTKRYRVEDVLMHVVEEEIHHRGELLCLMWQIDVEPPHRDWLDRITEKPSR